MADKPAHPAGSVQAAEIRSLRKTIPLNGSGGGPGRDSVPSTPPTEPSGSPGATSARGTDDRFHLVGATLEGKFRLDRVVAAGGFAVVYQGTDLKLQRPVAIKILAPKKVDDAARTDMFDRFRDEAMTIARLGDPHIVQVLDHGVATLPALGQSAWMALEWITGHTLTEEFRKRFAAGRYRPAESLALLRPVVEALAHAHDAGIAHRDIKPSNIMVTPTRRGPWLYLLDFGIAKVMEAGEEAGSGETRTRTATPCFSPRYAAPEQISGTRTGPWTDVYGLGLLFHEMLTGRTPYDGKDLTARYIDAMSRDRPTPAKRGIDVGAWEPVLARAVAIHPSDRFQNAGELLAALDAALPGAERPSVIVAAAPETESVPAVTVDGNSTGRASLSPMVATAVLQAVRGRSPKKLLAAAAVAAGVLALTALATWSLATRRTAPAATPVLATRVVATPVTPVALPLPPAPLGAPMEAPVGIPDAARAPSASAPVASGHGGHHAAPQAQAPAAPPAPAAHRAPAPSAGSPLQLNPEF